MEPSPQLEHKISRNGDDPVMNIVDRGSGFAAMRVVWVKKPKRAGAVRQSPLTASGHLMLDSIASHWKLDPESLEAGTLLLARDKDGNSRLTLDEIASLSPPGNNGLSEQSPLLISGPKTGGPREEVRNPWQGSTEREQAIYRKFYGSPDSVYAYADHLAKRVAPKKEAEWLLESQFIPQLVGDVYLVEPCGFATRTGFAILIKPDGTCWTALQCVKEAELQSGAAIEVRFRSGLESIRCKIGAKLGHRRYPMVACLVPLEAHAFKLCMPPLENEFRNEYLTLDKEMKLVMCMTFGSEVLVPCSPGIDPGAPVFNRWGKLTGIVTDPGLGKLDDPDDKLIFTSSGMRSVACRTMKKLIKSVKFRFFEDYTDFFRKVSTHKQLMEFSPITWKTPVHEWRDEHPIKEFATGTATKLSRVRVPKVAPRGKPLHVVRMTREEFIRLEQDKHAAKRRRMIISGTN